MDIRDNRVQNDGNPVLKGFREFDMFLPGNTPGVISALLMSMGGS